ncbi:MAG: polysaccharide deacetylase family protein [Chloroflexota bacterium]|nr:polysaccharide deacetylase family protein [Chloroflexota bacterium]
MKAETPIPTAAGRFPQFPVLHYHHVHNDEESFFRVTTEVLRSQLELLLAEGYTPLHPSRLTELKGGPRLGERYVLVTVDDAYENFLTHAWPVLKSLQIPTLLFVVSDYIGGWNDWDGIRLSRHRHLDLDQLRLLQEEGVVIGSHSRTHPILPLLDDDALLNEIQGSRVILEELLGRPVNTFAYPGGHVDRRIWELTSRHYDLAFATDSEHTGPFCDPFAIPRLDPSFFWDPADFKAELAAHTGLQEMKAHEF